MQKSKREKMNFSQSVIGKSSKRTKKPSVGKIVAPSVGKVNMSPNKKKGKRIF